jgi:hypothetical protein
MIDQTVLEIDGQFSPRTHISAMRFRPQIRQPLHPMRHYLQFASIRKSRVRSNSSIDGCNPFRQNL